MARWQPDSRRRLEASALELFEARGYDGTTAAQIAEHAGLTERTFFRHFADKREVLFDGSAEFQQRVLDGVAAAPSTASALDAAAAGMDAAAAFLQSTPDPEFPRLRAAVVAANPSLLERELLKLSTVTSASSRALQDRGASAMEAAIAAEVAMAAFRLAFERWVSSPQPPEHPDLRALVREGIAAFRALA